jgi:hypothetical protein
MALGPLFPGMVDTVGALLPAAIALALVTGGRARCGLGRADQFWLFAFSLTLSMLLCRVSITADATTLHIVPGATVFCCYLIWRGHAISPALAFALTYATCLPVDYLMAQAMLGADFNSEYIGGGGWRDGLLVLPAFNALAAAYANWRVQSRFGGAHAGCAARFARGHPVAFH